MAVLIPTLSACRFDTSGESRFAERLLEKLEDDYLCWHNTPIGTGFSQPDFVILNPRRGLLVLEVKDWKRDTLVRFDKDYFTIFTNGMSAPKKLINPLLNAKGCGMAMERAMSRDIALLQTDGAYAGRLCFPYGYGVVFTNISRADFEVLQMEMVIPPHLAICKDEMLPGTDAGVFQKRLWDMFTHDFGKVLSLPQVERIRWHLFPDVRVQSTQLSLLGGPPSTITDSIPDLVRVMDLQQEQLARSLGEGHRVIHGVAGSGKTMLLVHRCLHLARALTKPALVLCFNRDLAELIAARMAVEGLADKIVARNFHAWCGDLCQFYGVEKPKFQNGSQYNDELVERVLRAVDLGQIPRAQYGAILIDEGHDFALEWLRLAVSMVDPQTNSLLLLYDDAQSIYGKGKPRFALSSAGIDARGRTTIMRINYRNTAEVLSVAYEFARELLDERNADDDGIPVVKPLSAGRRGPLPKLVERTGFDQELAYIADEFRSLGKTGLRPEQMAVLCRTKAQVEQAKAKLAAYGLPVKNGSSASFVKITVMHVSKGLEFEAVAIPGLDLLPHKKAVSVDEDARLLYVGMTRATDKLLLTHSGDGPFVRRVSQAIALTRGS